MLGCEGVQRGLLWRRETFSELPPTPLRGKKVLASLQKSSQTRGRCWPSAPGVQPLLWEGCCSFSPQHSAVSSDPGLVCLLAVEVGDPIWGLLESKQEVKGMPKARQRTLWGRLQGTSPQRNQRGQSAPSKLQAGRREAAPQGQSSCLSLRLAFTESSVGHCVLFCGNKIPHSVECCPGARDTMVGQPGAGGLWMGQFLGAMGAGRLGLRAKMLRALILSPRKRQHLLSMLGSPCHQEHTCSQQGRVYYLRQPTSHQGSLGCLQKGELGKGAYKVVGAEVSQRVVFGKDWSEFAKQGVAGTVCDPG